MDTKQHLANVLRWAIGNGSDKQGNPYGKPEIREALKHLSQLEGDRTDKQTYLDVDLDKIIKG